MTTSNLSLIQPGPSDIVKVEDVANNFIAIDKYIGFMQVSTKEEVLSPFEGLKIMEASGAPYIYITGQGWVMMGSAVISGANGRKSYNTFTTNGSSSSGSEVMSNIKTTFTAETGRRYWVEVSVSLEFTSSDESEINCGAQCYLRYASGASVTTSDTIMNGKPHLVECSFYGNDVLSYDAIFLGEFTPNINGSVTAGLSYKALHNIDVLAKATSTAVNTILVRDVGASS